MATRNSQSCSKMKVLFTSLFPIWQCHAVAECNLAEDHLSAGDEVSFLQCEASLGACDANPTRALPVCATCVGIRQSAMSLLSKVSVTRFPIVKAGVTASLQSFLCPTFPNMDALRSYNWNGIHVGREVISSLVTAVGSPIFDTVEHSQLIKTTIIDYLSVYLTAVCLIEAEKFDLVYVFNGRFTSARAWIRACQKTQTDYITQERLAMPDRVLLIKNGSPHEMLRYAQAIRGFWADMRSSPEVLREAHEFFTERPKGKAKGWFSFTAEQQAGQLPKEWDNNRENIAIFASTESEFVGLPEFFIEAFFKDQSEAYYKIAKQARSKNKDIHFFLRVHPNSWLEKIRWWEDPKFASLENLTVIPPESPVSSYDLLYHSGKVVAFLSTMGIEATYWGKPSIILSNAMYRGIDGAYEPKTVEEAVELLSTAGLNPKPRDAALAYGGFIRCGAKKLPYSEAIDHCKLTFKGRRPNAPEPILRSLWNWENIVSKAPLPDWAKRLWQKWEWLRLRPINR